MGLLSELIRRQAGTERDARGCAHVAFEHDALSEYAELVQELIEARLLVQRPGDRYELAYFTCFDAGTDEWY